MLRVGRRGGKKGVEVTGAKLARLNGFEREKQERKIEKERGEGGEEACYET